ncbi:SDR family NAD(P)-dependent oxidoreductase [Rhodococcus sp. NCIMB 12038]|uniref:SDR family NAD(P)-dependent oxidoreductase n=1 Tax=Rhodococcus sp. NCIMB 12038 TaxID=933800 RepID=UPI000B3CA5BC|nr:SDR family oxidoreductase [Rhodococcus sp. NCIMB 12038]OUS92112.1 oxidoreductase [Rhodococcus sp. NCIMB 12038]
MVMIVTGAAQGIGQAVALLAAESGHDLLLVDRDAAGLDATADRVQEFGKAPGILPVDLSSPDSGERIVQHAVSEFEGIDAVVSNAGIVSGAPLAELDIASFDKTFAVNTRATWLLAKAAHPWLKKNKGVVLATASISAQHPTPPTGAYAASKAALVMLVRQMALEWGRDGIRCNCVSPGPTLSGMTSNVFGDISDAEQAENRKRREEHIPLGRIGESIDVARALLFLASPAASHITGIDLVVDGGLTTALMPAAGGGRGHS